MFGQQKLSGALLALIAAASLAACGGAPATSSPTSAAAPTAASAETTPAPEATAAAEAPTTAASTEGSTLVMGIAEDTTSLDPGRAYETTPSIVHKALYETLVTFPEDSVESIEPGLADSWEISEDGTTYTFSLRQGATFSDGNPVTADDVVFSFNRMKNLKGNPSFLAETIASVEASDPATVVLTLTQPDPAILAKLVFPAFSVVNSKVVQANGGTAADDAETADTAETWFNSNSAGSGPYTLESWEKGVETVLVRNPAYSGTPAAIERVIIRNLPEAATQKLQLEAGDIQIAFDLSSDQVATMTSNPSVNIVQSVGDTIFFLLMNEDPTIGADLSKPEVQKAVRLAIDYAGIKALTGGQAMTPASVLPIGFAGAYGEDKAPVRDVAAAQALLAEAGVSNLTVELEYPDFTFGGVNFGTMAQKIQADLAEAGITVNLKPTELQVALENYRNGNEQFGLWLWSPDYRDSLDYVEFLPAGVVGNRAKWTDENADAAILELRDKLKVETDDAARATLFGQMQDYLQESGPFAVLIQPGIQIGLTSNVQGFAYNPQWRVDVAKLSLSQ